MGLHVVFLFVCLFWASRFQLVFGVVLLGFPMGLSLGVVGEREKGGEGADREKRGEGTSRFNPLPASLWDGIDKI